MRAWICYVVVLATHNFICACAWVFRSQFRSLHSRRFTNSDHCLCISKHTHAHTLTLNYIYSIYQILIIPSPDSIRTQFVGPAYNYLYCHNSIAHSSRQSPTDRANEKKTLAKIIVVRPSDSFAFHRLIGWFTFWIRYRNRPVRGSNGSHRAGKLTGRRKI